MVVSTPKPEQFLWRAMTAHGRGVSVPLFGVSGSLDWPAQVQGHADRHRQSPVQDSSPVDQATFAGQTRQVSFVRPGTLA